MKFVWCHRMPSRSFHYCNGKQMPLCSRCTGLYLGFLSSIAYAFTSFSISILWSFILIIPMLVDGLIQYYYYYESTNFKRLVSGLLGGIGLMSIYDKMIKMILCILNY